MSMTPYEATLFLNHACYHGIVEDVFTALDSGADPQAIGMSGKCCLHFAAMAGHVHLCKVLAKMHPTALSLRDHGGMTPLHLACRNARHSAALVLCESGADTEARDDFGRKPTDCCDDLALRDKIHDFKLNSFTSSLAAAALAQALLMAHLCDGP